MKRILALGMSTVLTLPIMFTAVAYAVDGSTSESTRTTTTETDKPLSADELKALQTRLEKRKAELKVRLSVIEKVSIQTKCKAAQGLISNVKGRVKGIETSRTEVYANIITRLTDLSTKLKNKGSDTTALDANIATLQAKIKTFTTDLETYKQATVDLSGMDCKTDPDGFKASLLAARSAQETTSKDAQAVRSYVNDTIKPLLKTIRTELETKKAEGNQ